MGKHALLSASSSYRWLACPPSGITAMQKLLGKKKFEELLGGFVYKPQGKPTLAPESDKRPAMNTAIKDFSEN